MTSSQTTRCEAEIEKLKAHIRMQGKSIQTERDYAMQLRRYIAFICKTQWIEETTPEQKAEAYLTAEAMRGVSASTQNGAFYAICYYYRHIRKTPLQNVDAFRAKTGEHVRQAPSRGEGRVWWHCLEDTVQRAMRSANKRAGTEGLTPHHLRHAWATHAHHAGACLRDLQDILGHRDPKTTARYLRPDPERVLSPLETLHLAS